MITTTVAGVTRRRDRGVDSCPAGSEEASCAPPRSIRSRIITSVAAIGVIAGGGLALAPAANAEAPCSREYVCVFKHLSGTGYSARFSGNISNYRNQAWQQGPGLGSINDDVTSVTNWGVSCYVRLYDDIDGGGYSLTFGRKGYEADYEDPNLTNGNDTDHRDHRDHRDKFSSHKFIYCKS